MNYPVDCSVHFWRPYAISIVVTSPNQDTPIFINFHPILTVLAGSMSFFIYFAMDHQVVFSVHFWRPYVISIVATYPNQEHTLSASISNQFSTSFLLYFATNYPVDCSVHFQSPYVISTVVHIQCVWHCLPRNQTITEKALKDAGLVKYGNSAC